MSAEHWPTEVVQATLDSAAETGLQIIRDSISRVDRLTNFTPQTIAEAYAELDELRRENARLRSQIDHLNRTHPDCGAVIHDLQEENAGLRARIQELEGVESYHGKVTS